MLIIIRTVRYLTICFKLNLKVGFTMTTTLIKNIHLFTGTDFTPMRRITLVDEHLANLNAPLSAADNLVDGQGGYLIPGLIDAHTHTSNAGLHDALKFGITTELEMMGQANRRERSADTPVADVRSAGMGVTAKGGHPSELHEGAGIPASVQKELDAMTPEQREAMLAAHRRAQGQHGTIVTPADARNFVNAQIANGADYIKIMLDDGQYEASQPLPVLPREVLAAAVDEAHAHGKLVLAHALAQRFALEAVELGVDGLAHLFLERDDQTPAILDAIAEHQIFVTPCLVLNASLTGHTPENLAQDPRVLSRLNTDWQANLNRAFATATQLDFANSLANVADLRDRGVRILAGTDVSQPAPNLGGLAHGASVRHELQLLTQAGLTPAEALQAATAVPANIFAPDRGVLATNKRADLVLLGHNPLLDIRATLDIQGIWQAGKLLPTTIG